MYIIVSFLSLKVLFPHHNHSDIHFETKIQEGLMQLLPTFFELLPKLPSPGSFTPQDFASELDEI